MYLPETLRKILQLSIKLTASVLVIAALLAYALYHQPLAWDDEYLVVPSQNGGYTLKVTKDLWCLFTAEVVLAVC